MKLGVVLILLFCTFSHGARILGIFPTASISHQLPLQAVMKALAARGHEVTVITTNPLKEPMENYTDIDISFTYELMKTMLNLNAASQMSPAEMIKMMTHVSAVMCEKQLSSEPIQNFIRTNNKKFDLMAIEFITYQSYFGIHHLVGSPPLVGMLTVGPWMAATDSIGNPTFPAYMPDLMLPYSNHMTFWERMYNAYMYLWERHEWHVSVLPTQERILRKFFGDAPPPVAETERNVSLFMLGDDWTLGYPTPMLPNVIELTGLHIKTTPSPLPKNIKKFLDEAKDGVIYFSLGSNVKSNLIPEEKRQAILDVFSKLPQRVLWKWESDSLPGQPSNVMVGKWLPQQDILAHPNIRLFITQGGLQSFQEGSYNGVPFLGIPFFGDQGRNVVKMVNAGIGARLDFNDLNKETFKEVLEKLLNDPSYRDNMRRFSNIYRERVETSLPRAVWWMEYVLRHNGAKHLRSAALDLSWYQYLLLDVIAFMVAVVVLAVSVAFLTLRWLYRVVSRRLLSQKLKTN